MTNKPMLSVERDIIELAHTVFVRAGYESVARDLKILLCKKEDKQPAPVASESACTSCDGSGEYTDAIGDWRGYCTCPAGVEAEGIKGLMP